ncbi:MAG: NADH-quinone oxidoreductase subunit N [Anaerolineae bacterium]|nr:NADH-quinone oxidoreductase subunit N [Anaerolineae bacterium]
MGELMFDPGDIFRYLLPELILLATALLVLALDLLVSGERKHRCTFVAMAGMIGALAASIVLWAGTSQTRTLAILVFDPLALMIKILAILAILIVALLSDDYVRARSSAPGVFCALLLLSGLVVSLLASASDLIIIFLAFDSLSIIAYVLTGFLRDEARSIEAALKYFLYGATLSGVMAFGFSWIYGAVGSTHLQVIATFVNHNLTHSALDLVGAELFYMIMPALIMVGAGFAFKVAAAPFHHWAPDAYEGAPTPVSAFISVVPKIAGFAVIARFTFVVLPFSQTNLGEYWRALLIVFSVLAMIVGNLAALWQTNIKRLLAYSSISQAGYLLIGVIAGSRRGVVALLLYLSSYLLTNLGVFAGVIYVTRRARSDMIEEFSGLHQRAPWVAFCLLVGLLSLAGVPPTLGFFGKFWLFSAIIEAGIPWLAILAVLATVVSLAYYWKIIRAMYLLSPWSQEPFPVSAPALVVALVLTISSVLLGGLAPATLLSLFERAAGALFPG